MGTFTRKSESDCNVNNRLVWALRTRISKSETMKTNAVIQNCNKPIWTLTLISSVCLSVYLSICIRKAFIPQDRNVDYPTSMHSFDSLVCSSTSAQGPRFTIGDADAIARANE